jgi:glycosyltransferase involved in cell wall biosynthesis
MFRRQQHRFLSLLEEIKPDVIHAQGADAAGFLAVRSGHPGIVTLHGILTECARFRTDVVKRLREQLQAKITEQLVVRRARHIVAISPYIARYYRDRIGGIVHDIPNAVAPPFFQVARVPERKRFLFAGRISRGKGLLDLVRAAAGRPGSICHITLAGASPEPEFRTTLESEISLANLGDRIHLVGLLDENALLAEFSRASALVLPSYQETAPMVIQQAMAAGLPVIATRVGGIPDLIQHEITGLLYEPGDIDGLARLMSRLGEDDALADRLAVAAKEIASQQFGADNVAKATISAYRKVVAAR